MNQGGRLSEIRRIAKDALIEAGAVTPCERHDGILIHRDSAGAEIMAFNLASVWIEREIGSSTREELREAVRAVLASAGKDGCPECAKAKGAPTVGFPFGAGRLTNALSSGAAPLPATALFHRHPRSASAPQELTSVQAPEHRRRQ
jgi:hypothetical protein